MSVTVMITVDVIFALTISLSIGKYILMKQEKSVFYHSFLSKAV